MVLEHLSARTARALAGVAAALAMSACAENNALVEEDDEGSITYERNSEFLGPYLEVFITAEDGAVLSVNTDEDAIETQPQSTPIPGHGARSWTFLKERAEGTSIAYALVSWDSHEPQDYLMAGWWAEFPGQRPPDLSFEDSLQYAIVDGPELDPEVPPDVPTDGQATYTGQAGGLYTYTTGSHWAEDAGIYVLEEWEGTMTLVADFADNTLSGCVGCVGELTTARAHFGVFLGAEETDFEFPAADYRIHLGETPIRPEGTFEHADVVVSHPERTITQSAGNWGGALSNIPDAAGDPRIAAGFVSARFLESDESAGRFLGAFVTLSDTFAEGAE